MDDYNWDDFDAQSNEYLNSDAYQGDAFTTDDGNVWGGYNQLQNSINQQGQQDLGNMLGSQGLNENQWENSMSGLTTGGAPYDFSGGTQYTSPSQLPQIPQQSMNLGGIQNTLSSLFNNKGLVTGLGALAEGYQNKRKAAALQQMVSQNSQSLDPFGSQRQFYQQQLQQAVQDPYSSPMVSAQVEQLKRAQQIKDAQAGRRSNSATTDPALMAAMAGVAQNYMNSLQTPAGANIGPQGLSGLMSAQQQGINNDVNGYLSPALSALAKSSGTDQNTRTLEALKEFLSGGR